MAIRAYLRNPEETAALIVLLAAGIATPTALAAAAAFFSACEIAAGLRRAEGPRWWPAVWPRAERPLTILYDATCGLCARSRRHLETWPTAAWMRFVPLQSAEARALVPHLSEKDYLGAMHAVEDGRLYSAEEAWFRIMRLGPLGSACLAWLTPRWLAGPVYAWVARNRYRWFGRVCEGGTCAVHPTSSAGKPSSPPSGSPGPS